MEALADLSLSTFTFRQRANALVPDQRLSWRVPLLLLTLRYSRAGKSSFQRLAILAYALNTPEGQDEIEIALESGRLYSAPIRFEPGFPNLLTYAMASGLIEIAGQSFSLTEAGRTIVALCEAEDIFSSERAFLAANSKKLTEAQAKKIIGIDLTDVV